MLKSIIECLNEATVISFDKKIGDIKNFKELPEEIQKEIEDSDSITSHGFQELNGYNGRQVVWSAGGPWTGKDEKDKFVITSYGSNKWQWDGKNLKKV